MTRLPVGWRRRAIVGLALVLLPLGVACSSGGDTIDTDTSTTLSPGTTTGPPITTTRTTEPSDR